MAGTSAFSGSWFPLAWKGTRRLRKQLKRPLVLLTFLVVTCQEETFPKLIMFVYWGRPVGEALLPETKMSPLNTCVITWDRAVGEGLSWNKLSFDTPVPLGGWAAALLQQLSGPLNGGAPHRRDRRARRARKRVQWVGDAACLFPIATGFWPGL